MTGEPVITVVGNLTADPELRFSPSGSAVANFTIASTPKTFDRQSNEYKDGETLFMRCSIWREYAENVAETLTKGTRVVAQGRLKSRSFDTKEGEKRTVMELEVDEIGPALRFATARVTRSERGQGGQQGQGQSQAQQGPPQGQPQAPYGGAPQQPYGGPQQGQPYGQPPQQGQWPQQPQQGQWPAQPQGQPQQGEW